jgi:Tol biopolymer transport system component
MLVPEPEKPFVDPPTPPEGATWAEPPRVICELHYRADGTGYLEKGFSQILIVPAEGGTPRQVTSGSYHHREAPLWAPDGETLVFSANRNDD